MLARNLLVFTWLWLIAHGGGPLSATSVSPASPPILPPTYTDVPLATAASPANVSISLSAKSPSYEFYGTAAGMITSVNVTFCAEPCLTSAPLNFTVVVDRASSNTSINFTFTSYVGACGTSESPPIFITLIDSVLPQASMTFDGRFCDQSAVLLSNVTGPLQRIAFNDMLLSYATVRVTSFECRSVEFSGGVFLAVNKSILAIANAVGSDSSLIVNILAANVSFLQSSSAVFAGFSIDQVSVTSAEFLVAETSDVLFDSCWCRATWLAQPPVQWTVGRSFTVRDHSSIRFQNLSVSSFVSTAFLMKITSGAALAVSNFSSIWIVGSDISTIGPPLIVSLQARAALDLQQQSSIGIWKSNITSQEGPAFQISASGLNCSIALRGSSQIVVSRSTLRITSSTSAAYAACQVWLNRCTFSTFSLSDGSALRFSDATLDGGLGFGLLLAVEGTVSSNISILQQSAILVERSTVSGKSGSAVIRTTDAKNFSWLVSNRSTFQFVNSTLLGGVLFTFLRATSSFATWSSGSAWFMVSCNVSQCANASAVDFTSAVGCGLTVSNASSIAFQDVNVSGVLLSDGAVWQTLLSNSRNCGVNVSQHSQLSFTRIYASDGTATNAVSWWSVNSFGSYFIVQETSFVSVFASSIATSRWGLVFFLLDSNRSLVLFSNDSIVSVVDSTLTCGGAAVSFTIWRGADNTLSWMNGSALWITIATIRSTDGSGIVLRHAQTVNTTVLVELSSRWIIHQSRVSALGCALLWVATMSTGGQWSVAGHSSLLVIASSLETTLSASPLIGAWLWAVTLCNDSSIALHSDSMVVLSASNVTSAVRGFVIPEIFLCNRVVVKVTQNSTIAVNSCNISCGGSGCVGLGLSSSTASELRFEDGSSMQIRNSRVSAQNGASGALQLSMTDCRACLVTWQSNASWLVADSALDAQNRSFVVDHSASTFSSLVLSGSSAVDVRGCNLTAQVGYAVVFLLEQTKSVTLLVDSGSRFSVTSSTIRCDVCVALAWDILSSADSVVSVTGASSSWQLVSCSVTARQGIRFSISQSTATQILWSHGASLLVSGSNIVTNHEAALLFSVVSSTNSLLEWNNRSIAVVVNSTLRCTGAPHGDHAHAIRILVQECASSKVRLAQASSLTLDHATVEAASAAAGIELQYTADCALVVEDSSAIVVSRSRLTGERNGLLLGISFSNDSSLVWSNASSLVVSQTVVRASGLDAVSVRIGNGTRCSLQLRQSSLLVVERANITGNNNGIVLLASGVANALVLVADGSAIRVLDSAVTGLQSCGVLVDMSSAAAQNTTVLVSGSGSAIDVMSSLLAGDVSGMATQFTSSVNTTLIVTQGAQCTVQDSYMSSRTFPSLWFRATACVDCAVIVSDGARVRMQDSEFQQLGVDATAIQWQLDWTVRSSLRVTNAEILVQGCLANASAYQPTMDLQSSVGLIVRLTASNVSIQDSTFSSSFQVALFFSVESSLSLTDGSVVSFVRMNSSYWGFLFGSTNRTSFVLDAGSVMRISQCNFSHGTMRVGFFGTDAMSLWHIRGGSTWEISDTTAVVTILSFPTRTIIESGSRIVIDTSSTAFWLRSTNGGNLTLRNRSTIRFERCTIRRRGLSLPYIQLPATLDVDPTSSFYVTNCNFVNDSLDVLIPSPQLVSVSNVTGGSTVLLSCNALNGVPLRKYPSGSLSAGVSVDRLNCQSNTVSRSWTLHDERRSDDTRSRSTPVSVTQTRPLLPATAAPTVTAAAAKSVAASTGVSAAVAVLAGPDILNANTQAVLGMIRCGVTIRMADLSSPVAYVISPLLPSYGLLPAMFFNIGFCAAVAVVHYSIGRSMVNEAAVAATPGAQLAPVWIQRAMVLPLLPFPDASLRVAYLLLPGAFFCAAALVTVSNGGGDIAAGVVVLVAIAACSAVLHQNFVKHILSQVTWEPYMVTIGRTTGVSSKAAPKEKPDCAADDVTMMVGTLDLDRVSIVDERHAEEAQKFRFLSLLEPRGRWSPLCFRASFGSSFSAARNGFPSYVVLQFVLSLVTSLASGLGIGTTGVACRTMLGLLSAMFVASALVLLWLRPFRHPYDWVTSPFQYALFGASCAFKAAGSDDNASLLSGLQTAVLMIRMICLLVVRLWVEPRMLCEEAPVTRECAQSFFPLAAAGGPAPNTAKVGDSSKVAPQNPLPTLLDAVHTSSTVAGAVLLPPMTIAEADLPDEAIELQFWGSDGKARPSCTSDASGVDEEDLFAGSFGGTASSNASDLLRSYHASGHGAGGV